MDKDRLRALLDQVAGGSVPVDDALASLRELPYADLGFAKVDHHRALRQGVPEIVFGQGKSAQQIAAIVRELGKGGGNVLVTRVDADKAAHLVSEVSGLRYAEAARCATLEQKPIASLSKGTVALLCAGTADVPVAEECAETMRMLGIGFERVYDVGVAGIHRLLSKREIFDRTAIAIVVAGMEGALPSAVGGMVSIPVIAVPTSVGYGAALAGFTALGCMLTSCASGVTVCNIDNGFGAAFAAARILQSASRF